MNRTLRTTRLTLSTLLVSLASASAVLVSSSGASAQLRSHTPYPACSGSGLVNWLDTQGNGAAGTIYYKLQFTNLSGHTCTMNGYPGVSAVGLTGHQIGGAAARVGASIHPLVLIKGATVRANLGIVQAGNFSVGSCHPTTAAGLRVYAPNQTASNIIPFPFTACATGNVLRIYPVTAT